jgi:uncharacterized phage protein (TIGR02220 family)
MPKDKDPAVLFYTADFLADTTLWSYEELGRYIKLLCIQHLNGGIAPEDFEVVAEHYSRVTSKFDLHDDGKYRNKRMQEEAEKRKLFTESRRANRRGKSTNEKHMKDTSATSDNHMKNICKTSVKHMENENVNDNENINKDIIHYLNTKLGTKYKASAEYVKKHINARLNEGYTLEDFKTVIDKKYKEWSGTEFAKFLRPETLFGTKFSTYLNQLGTEVQEASYTSFNVDDAFERALERSYEEF